MIIGSNYFFKNIKGFKSKDIDYLYIEKSSKYKYLMQQSFCGECVFRVNKVSKDKLIRFHKKLNDPLTIGKFLIPEFNKEFGITIDDIKEFEELFNKLDNKHLYQKQIYEYYLLNNSFTLTEAQLKNCYNLYKKYRYE